MRRQQSAYMTSITIRDVPPETHAELAARAAAAGQSLQEYLRARLVEIAERPDVAALMAAVEARSLGASHRLPPERILEHLDAGRR
jgi:plasmid stability protein